MLCANFPGIISFDYNWHFSTPFPVLLNLYRTLTFTNCPLTQALTNDFVPFSVRQIEATSPVQMPLQIWQKTSDETRVTQPKKSRGLGVRKENLHPTCTRLLEASVSQATLLKRDDFNEALRLLKKQPVLVKFPR
jgi:hypothetical protein